LSQDWKSFVRRVYVAQPVSWLYRAWATTEGMESWFLQRAQFRAADGALRERDEFVQPQDTYAWHWHGYNFTGEGQITEANGVDFVQFTFVRDAVVSVKFAEGEKRTLVELRQENHHDDGDQRAQTFVECFGGWTYHLTNLRSVAEGGLDLREKEHHVEDLVND
jgi:uncharacterized protein YndB with AHSA1/START domain